MAPSVRVKLTRKKEEGPCGQCPEPIPKEELHATTVRTFGKSQAGKTKYDTSHIHVACVPAFLLSDYVRWQARERKPVGRPRAIPSEFREERRKLIRTRARLLRGVLETSNQERIEYLKGRILETQRRLAECGGMPRQSMMRRSASARIALETKLGASTTGSLDPQ